MQTTIKILGLFWGAIFLLFAGWQFNDPDPMVWVTIYGMSAILCLLAAFDRVPVLIFPAVAIAALIGTFLLWPDRYQGLSLENGYTPGIEEARESLGLAIIALAMILLGLFSWLRKRKRG